MNVRIVSSYLTNDMWRRVCVYEYLCSILCRVVHFRCNKSQWTTMPMQTIRLWRSKLNRSKKRQMKKDNISSNNNKILTSRKCCKSRRTSSRPTAYYLGKSLKIIIRCFVVSSLFVRRSVIFFVHLFRIFRIFRFGPAAERSKQNHHCPSSTDCECVSILRA